MLLLKEVRRQCYHSEEAMVYHVEYELSITEVDIFSTVEILIHCESVN